MDHNNYYVGELTSILYPNGVPVTTVVAIYITIKIYLEIHTKQKLEIHDTESDGPPLTGTPVVSGQNIWPT